MQLFRRILVALARDAADREVVNYARLLASMEPGSQLDFVHVLEWHGPGPVVNHERALAEIRELAGGRASCHVLHGAPLDHLLEFAAESRTDLILMGHRKGSTRRSLARRLAMKAPCSVWTVPQESAARISRIVAAVDFSEASAQALSYAAAIAQCGRLRECLALHVYFDDAVVSFDGYDTIVRGREQEAFESFVAPLDLHGIEVHPIFVESPSVSKAVTRRAEGEHVDLVVMGTRGRSPSASVLLGSESEQMIMESRIPLVIVKQRGERIGLLRVLLDRDFHAAEPPRFG